MKRTIIAVVTLFFLLATATPGISKDFNRDSNGRPNYKERPADKNRPDYRGRHDSRERRGYKGPPKYLGQPGYRTRPYDKHRQYKYYDYKGHRYTYNGHWRSWGQWDRYARQHPDIYKHGRYYREGRSLMFRLTDPATGNFIFFSIGR